MARRGRPFKYEKYDVHVSIADVREALAEVKLAMRAENAKSFRARHAGDPDASRKAFLAKEPRTLREFLAKEPGSRAAKCAN